MGASGCAERAVAAARRDPSGAAADGHGPQRVLIFTASVGAGHEAAGRALQADLIRAGHRALVRDGLRLLSPSLNQMMTSTYTVQLNYVPWSLRLVFWGFTQPSVAVVVRRLLGRLFGDRLGRTIQTLHPDVVVSTYPALNSTLGDLRRRRRLATPVAALIPDFGVHPLWVSPDLDLHLVASRRSAELAWAMGGRALAVQIPVAAAIREPIDRDAARADLQLERDAFVVLLAGGSWGVGDFEQPIRAALDAGAAIVVLSGHNERLRAWMTERFGQEPGVRILGWTDQVPRLLRACDCLIQNAGGMTCVEAIETHIPIVFVNPIPGHGEWNARMMAESGAITRVDSEAALRDLLRGAVRGERQLPRPCWGPDTPPAAEVVAALALGPPLTPPAPAGVAPGV